MNAEAAATKASGHPALELPWPLLSVDVETNPADDNRIFLIGAVRSDDSRSLTISTRRAPAHEVQAGCPRRSNFDPPCRLNFDPGLVAGIA
jgi:hypothetical protein